MATAQRDAAGPRGVRGQATGRFLRRPDMYEGVAAENDVGRMDAVFA